MKIYYPLHIKFSITSSYFNFRNSSSCCFDTSAKGLEVATLLSQSNLCLLDKKDTTYIHPVTGGSHSSIDLAICEPALFLDLSWNVRNDLCCSDHLPMILLKSLESKMESTEGLLGLI